LQKVTDKEQMTVRLHRILWLGLWLVNACASAGLHAALTPEKLYQKVLPSVMTLEVISQSGEKYIGSAVLALADDVVLTAWHVVADARSVCAVFADGQCMTVIGCIDYDGGRDLALLKLEKRLPHRRAVLGRELPAVAARAYVIGSPKGYDFSISDGLISQIRSVRGFRQYQLSCPISPGNSGSPVFNQRGEVIGIASWTKAGAQNLSFAIPTQDFIRLKVFERPTTWAQLAATTRPAPRASLMESRHSNDKALDEKTDGGGFAAFKKRLSDSTGKSVTVVFQEEERTNTFAFTVK
jgi:S1-C subfamily serine protease